MLAVSIDFLPRHRELLSSNVTFVAWAPRGREAAALTVVRRPRATNGSFHRRLRGLKRAVDGLKVDDGGVTAEIEEILAGAKVAGAAALFAG